jgi:hypothetical protein
MHSLQMSGPREATDWLSMQMNEKEEQKEK